VVQDYGTKVTRRQGLSRRDFLLASAAIPFAVGSRSAVPADALLAATDEVVSWFDPRLRGQLSNVPSLGLDGTWAIAQSRDGSEVLFRSYDHLPFKLSVAGSASLVPSASFPEPVASVKGAVLQWPRHRHLFVASGVPGRAVAAVIDPIAGRVLRQREWPAGAASASVIAASWADGAALVLPGKGGAEVLFVGSSLQVSRRVPIDITSSPQAILGAAPVLGGVLVAGPQGLRFVDPHTGNARHVPMRGLALGRHGEQADFRATAVARTQVLVETGVSNRTSVVLVDVARNLARTVSRSPGAYAVAPGIVVDSMADGWLSVIDVRSGRRARIRSNVGTLKAIDVASPYLLAATTALPQERVAVDLRTMAEAGRGTFASAAPSAVPRV
jgi:hypothetical protein